ncbi:Uncharacterised protein [Klebsiella pneumoniae]|jgi:hypothetical protein|nr:Uncharacterised protein [Klebsiella pneumoniae]SWH51741.1 Uncharacterised protein [Klebsiella pneumoniae]
MSHINHAHLAKNNSESKRHQNKHGEQAEPRKPLHDKNGSQIGEVIIAEHGSILGEVKAPPRYMGGSVG